MRPPARGRVEPARDDVGSPDLREAVGGVVAVVVSVARAVVAFLRRTSAENGERDGIRITLSPQQTRRRLTVVCVAVCLLFGVVVVRLVNLQVIESDRLTSLNASQRMRTQTLPAERGAILDRNGVELALSLPRTSIFADPALIHDPDGTAAALAPVLTLSVEELLPKLRNDGKTRFVYLARHVEDEVADKIEALGLEGIASVDEPKRFNPGGDLATGIVGLTDIDSHPMSGLEKEFDELLTGTPGKIVFEQSADGRTIPVGENLVEPAAKGSDLVVTIDRAMQFEVQRILTEQVRQAQAKGGIAVVSKPDTGDILAMAQVVTDEETGEVAPTVNAAGLTTTYEPGSVMKLVTATGAIEEGLVEPETVLDLPVSLQIADGSFSDAEPRGPVAWDVKEIITQSSNVGTIMLGQKLGRQRVYDYIRDFGFGQRTAIEFPNEAAGVVAKPEKWWDTSMGTIPIGQGVAVTPVQMLTAYNVIANRGRYVAPRLVSDHVDAAGVRRAFPAPDPRQVVSVDTADEINLILRNVVSKGTGTKAAVDGYTVAGKTGTSRKPYGGSYTWPDGRTHYEATFVGFAPAEAPAVSVIVIIDDPNNGQIFGGELAAPAFSKITEFALRVLGVAPPATDMAQDGAAADPNDQATKRAAGVVPEPPDFTVTDDGRKRAVPTGRRAEEAAEAEAAAAAGGDPGTGAYPGAGSTGTATGSTGTGRGTGGTP